MSAAQQPIVDLKSFETMGWNNQPRTLAAFDPFKLALQITHMSHYMSPPALIEHQVQPIYIAVAPTGNYSLCCTVLFVHCTLPHLLSCWETTETFR